VLVYHRVQKAEGHAFDKDVIEATPDEFDEQVGMLKRRHTVVDGEELAALVEKPGTLRGFPVAITFDDGYRDNYTNAFPILRSHGVRATFFLPTDLIGTRRLPWWDQVASAVRRSTRRELRFVYPAAAVIAREGALLEQAIRAVLRLYTRDPTVDIERYLAEVERACDVTLEPESAEPQFMSWDEAREMERGGMAIGSHTHTHRILANLGPGDQRAECVDSMARLRERGLSPAGLAYPVGGLASFTKETVEVARAAGYRYAVSNYGGINVPAETDAFDVRRLGMEKGTPLAELRLRLALSGLGGRAAW
jgi:peptidoglycan/xylan/chitin deacetylase (PgdA/CDA1 family)